MSMRGHRIGVRGKTLVSYVSRAVPVAQLVAVQVAPLMLVLEARLEAALVAPSRVVRALMLASVSVLAPLLVSVSLLAVVPQLVWTSACSSVVLLAWMLSSAAS